MNNSSCISHLLIPDSDQIQIVVSRSSVGRAGATGTDIRVTALNRKAGRVDAVRGQSTPLSFTEIPPRVRGRSPTKIPALRRSSGSSGISLSPSGTPVAPCANEDTEKFEDFLRSSSELVEDCIARCVDKEVLERIVIQNLSTEEEKQSFLTRWKFNVAGPVASNRLPLKGLTVSLGSKLVEGAVRWQLAQFISSIVYADSFTLYLADKTQTNLRVFSSTSLKPELAKFSIQEARTLGTYVAKRRQALSIERSDAEVRFPDGVGDAKKSTEQSFYILCLPILSPHGDIAGVIELHRLQLTGPFRADDEDIANSYLIWGGIAFHYADMNVVLNKQTRLNDFLLNVVKSIFQDMVSMDSVIKKVMKFAQKLVDADRASLFLLDNKTKELYARIFDLEWDNESQGKSDENNTTEVNEIRFALGTGIAGQVASTGNPLRVADAYEDARFNSDVDKQTGYRTVSILCMPVFIKSTVIGVVQMVNKKSGEFTKDDEEAFETFAVYCGLALHHAKLYDKIRRSEQKSKVAVEILSYHNTCNNSEFDMLRKSGLPQTVLGLDDFYFPPSSLDEMTKVHYAVYMFFDLFGHQRFDQDTLYRFSLTVRKNYRRVPYHNWNHGWTVANSMYCILKASNIFRPLECLALYVGSLCHDLDHRGKNNKFLADTASPLASIYTTSTMEHHHFNQTVTILQQEGHNIFCQLSSDEYKQVLGNIKHCILATDLALFFPYKTRLQELISKETYSWGVPDHRLLTQAIAMTAADLCASAKPWELQQETVKVIFAEFYEQGDYEKSMGRTPLPMMDRNQSDQQPSCQVGFLKGICIPCYDTLYKLIPETLPLQEGCQKNLKQWQDLADVQAQKKKEQEGGGGTE